MTGKTRLRYDYYYGVDGDVKPCSLAHSAAVKLPNPGSPGKMAVKTAREYWYELSVDMADDVAKISNFCTTL